MLWRPTGRGCGGISLITRQTPEREDPVAMLSGVAAWELERISAGWRIRRASSYNDFSAAGSTAARQSDLAVSYCQPGFAIRLLSCVSIDLLTGQTPERKDLTPMFTGLAAWEFELTDLQGWRLPRATGYVHQRTWFRPWSP